MFAQIVEKKLPLLKGGKEKKLVEIVVINIILAGLQENTY
jgi:hypothetical protein